MNKMEKMSLEEFKQRLENIFSDCTDPIKCTFEFRKLNVNYPYLRTESPYKDIYQEYIRKWHDEIYLNQIAKMPQEEQDRISREMLAYKGEEPVKTVESSRIYNFGLFLEAKKESTDEVKREAKKIISEMFAFGKNIKFSGDQNGEPEYVEFEIDANDYKLGYSENLKMDYTEGVMKKRKYQVSLKFDSKSKEGTEEKPVYKIKFKINLKPSGEVEVKKPKKPDYDLAWEFEKKPSELIAFVKKEKQKCEWSESDKVLYIKKSAYDRLSTAEFKSLVREEGGVKVQA